MSSHDITHCRGDKCKKKELCHRYLQHLELIKQTPPIGPYLPAESCIKEKYIAYWKSDAK